MIITAGKKASQFIARTRRSLAAEFTYKDSPLFAEARAISRFIRSRLFTYWSNFKIRWTVRAALLNGASMAKS